jgi:hypothetical protein
MQPARVCEVGDSGPLSKMCALALRCSKGSALRRWVAGEVGDCGPLRRTCTWALRRSTGSALGALGLQLLLCGLPLKLPGKPSKQMYKSPSWKSACKRCVMSPTILLGVEAILAMQSTKLIQDQSVCRSSTTATL